MIISINITKEMTKPKGEPMLGASILSISIWSIGMKKTPKEAAIRPSPIIVVEILTFIL